MEKIEYATEGRAWYSVITPGFFREYNLPLDPRDDTRHESRLRQKLADFAEHLGTYVNRTDYRLG
jgi:hypothetical protein